MTNTWNKAGGLLLGCVVALGSAACDDGGGKTTSDAGSQDSGSQDSGSQDAAMDAALQDAAQDAAPPAAAYVRLAHLAYQVGTPSANPIAADTTFKVHVCVLTEVASNNTFVANTLFTAHDGGTGGTHSYSASPLQYGAISAYNAAPLVALNSTATLRRTAQIWAQDDIDETMFGTGVAANCAPKATRTPIAQLVIPQNGTTGAFEDMKKYTIVVTGRWSWSGGPPQTPSVATICLSTTNTGEACPAGSQTPTINVIGDTVTAPTTGTAWRMINTSTSYAAQSSCHATFDSNTAATTKSTGPSVPLIPVTGMASVPLPVGRVGSTVTAQLPYVLSTPYVNQSNIVVSALPELFGPGLGTSCPTALFTPPPNNGTPGPDALMGQFYANGSVPQNASITAGYAGGVAATAVGNTGTADGNVVTAFIIDYNNPGGVSMPPVPAQVLIRDNAP